MEGNFIKASDTECIMELIAFIDTLKIDRFIDARNNSNITPFFGKSKSNDAIIEKLNYELERG